MSEESEILTSDLTLETAIAEKEAAEEAIAGESEWWRYENLQRRQPMWHEGVELQEQDQLDFHVDLGGGKLPKAPFNIDRHGPSDLVELYMDLETLTGTGWSGESQKNLELHKEFPGEFPSSPVGVLPFPDNSIGHIITHHCLEHLTGKALIRIMDETYRVMKPGSIFRVIVPAFPSYTAVSDPDHASMFMDATFQSFCGTAEGEHWHESFSVPYTAARFEMIDYWETELNPPEIRWTSDDVREIRVSLKKWE